MWQFIKQLFKEKQKHSLGLLPTKLDGSEYTLGALWGIGEYTPKKASSGLKTLSIKYQLYNTCSFSSAVCAKEIDEGIELDPRFVVIMARRESLLSGDGWANQKAAEIILQKYGCCEKGILPDYGNTNLSWEQYSDYRLITQSVLDNASKHKTASYWWVSNHNECLKALDEGHPVRFGVGWRDNMNMSGGFSIPWLLNFLKGYLIGGHDIFTYDWNLNYQGKRVFICQNSYGKTYGDNGKMYITFEDFNKQVAIYTATADLDIAKDTAKWLLANNGKCIKEQNSPAVWLIENGKKRLFADMATLFVNGFRDADIYQDTDNILPDISKGDDVNFWNGKLVNQFYEMCRMVKDDTLKENFKKYFNDLL